ncbi:type II toxin-antitoxin system prevent-host-death family antitoxin [Hydrogenimonas sp.]|jgi:prevent-host-death family protein|uniref:type II toxin-antitoxin system Phd/YefM family antitoxin n=1 Tax=Hydrogenimonas sp. TaxID=2231112 RepID=UPI0026143B00|nr:type II toxin-antitoxin system prevent-host-death family antitoxin [Hydrogenimonas sp.]
MTVNMHEAKTTLSKLVELAQKGEEIIIAKAGKAVAVLKPYRERPTRRRPGRLKGKPLDMSRFDEADESIEKLFTKESM